MKKVKNLIKLTNLSSESLNEKKQNVVIAGGDRPPDFCACYYSYCEGSSTFWDTARDNLIEPYEPPYGPVEANYAQ